MTVQCDQTQDVAVVPPEAQGPVYPQEGDTCKVIINNDGSEGDASSMQYEMGKEIDIIIGECDSLQSQKINACLCTMKTGSTTTISLPTDNNISTAVNVSLNFLSIKTRKPLWDMEPSEKLEIAEHHKQIGTELFKEKNTAAAFNRFSKAGKYLICMGKETDIPEDIIEKWRILKCQVHLNLAACQLQSESFDHVIVNCTKALQLQGMNVKALFRRGQAFMGLGQYQEAVADLTHAANIEPDNKAISKQLTLARSKAKKDSQSMATAMNKMFS